jgi:hypothetical protein
MLIAGISPREEAAMRSIVRFLAFLLLVPFTLLAVGLPIGAAQSARMANAPATRTPINQMQMPFRGAMSGGVAATASPFAMNANMLGFSASLMAGSGNMGFNPGAYGNPTGGYGSGAMMYGAGSSMPSYSSGYGYGSQGYAGSDAAGNLDQGIPTANMQTTTLAPAHILSAMGVPNEGGQITWPFELRVMGPSEVTGLRTQLEGLLQLLAMQAAREQVNPRAVDAARQAVNRLDALLLQDKERGGLGMTSFEDSERFLRQLREGLKRLQ